jgi:tetratricopeptide (TPR) repeat protein
MQSKMYARDVRCSDCHDVHSIRRIKKGNDLCLQCHRAAIYDRKGHHFHKTGGEVGEPIKSAKGEVLFEVGSGARCEACHMPGRNYMGIDYRPDHSFRLPRPDLTLSMKTPNACDRCHVDKPTQWSVDAMAKWYGRTWRPHYGQILQAGRQQQPEAAAELASLAQDRLYPTIVRATALAELAAYEGATVRKAFTAALTDEESLMRQTAVRHLPVRDPAERLKLLTPLLYDPVRAVRIEAAGIVAELHPDTLPADTRRQFDKALAEYRHAMERTADFAASRHNLGNLARSRGHFQEAEEQYRKAIAIDDQFYPAKVNLAMLYNQLGRNGEAERLLQDVLQQHPDLYELQYSLGLLLAEQQRWAEAAVHLEQAAAGLPRRARIHYNLGLLLQKLNRDGEAEKALQAALALEPRDPDFLYALAVFYLDRGNREKARAMAERLTTVDPGSPAGRQLLEIIEMNQ